MLIWLTTIILVLLALGGWLFLKRDPDRYIHEKSSPINFFFRWGRAYHHYFKAAIIVLAMLLIFSFYRYLLGASGVVSLALAAAAGAALSAGKELLDKAITLDDVATSILGIVLGAVIILLLFF